VEGKGGARTAEERAHGADERDEPPADADVGRAAGSARLVVAWCVRGLLLLLLLEQRGRGQADCTLASVLHHHAARWGARRTAGEKALLVEDRDGVDEEDDDLEERPDPEVRHRADTTGESRERRGGPRVRSASHLCLLPRRCSLPHARSPAVRVLHNYSNLNAITKLASTVPRAAALRPSSRALHLSAPRPYVRASPPRSVRATNRLSVQGGCRT
jgi:hypothetical protein